MSLVLGAADDHAPVAAATVDYEVVNAPAEEGADAALRAYNRLASDPDVIGIVWGGTTGLVEAMPQIRRDQMPVIACYADPYARGVDLRANPTVFQTMPPANWLLDEMARYAAQDRGYRTVGLLADTTIAPDSPTWMRDAVTSAGLEVATEQTYSLFDADSEPSCRSCVARGRTASSSTGWSTTPWAS